MEPSCGICLAPGDCVNHLDHLSPLAYILDIPIVVDEKLLEETVEKYYPNVKRLYIDHHAKILEHLAGNYNTLFVSCANYRAELAPLFEVLYRKKMNFWYCPHGNSDKAVDSFKRQTFAFTYGDQMEDRLRDAGILDIFKGFVRTGNYRLSFYRKYESFYDDLVEKEIFSQFAKKQPTILYAPTWQDLEKSTSFFDVGLTVAEQLPPDYNLIIKIHPWIVHYKAGYVQHLEEKYRDTPNVVVLPLYPLVLPILKRTDIYLGDFSSIGYDFLYYNRPMFFFEGSERQKVRDFATDLHSCGTLIPENAYGSLYSFIEKHLKEQESLKEKRKDVFNYAFGEERSFEAIREDIKEQIAAQV